MEEGRKKSSTKASTILYPITACTTHKNPAGLGTLTNERPGCEGRSEKQMEKEEGTRERDHDSVDREEGLAEFITKTIFVSSPKLISRFNGCCHSARLGGWEAKQPTTP